MRQEWDGSADRYNSFLPVTAKGVILKRIATVSFLLIPILFVAGCASSLITPLTPTVTCTPTNTSTPTRTATPTAAQTLSPTPGPLVVLGERHELTAAGFAFRVPIGYASQIEEQQAFISNLEGTFVILLAGGESASSEEELIDAYLDELAKRSQGEFEKTHSDPVTVDGRQGNAYDLTGSLSGSPLEGKTFIIPLRSNRFFFALAIFNLSEDEQAWRELGSKVFEAVLESIEFIKPSG